MTIKEFARLCNCNPQTLRYYDRMDLLKPVKVDPYSGYRYYNEEQAIQYVKIKNLQLAGFSIDEIKSLLDADSDTVNDAFSEKIRQQEEKLQKIRDIQQSYQDEIERMKEKVQVLREAVLKSMTEYDPTDEFGIDEEEYKAIVDSFIGYLDNHEFSEGDIEYDLSSDEEDTVDTKKYLDFLNDPGYEIVYELHDWEHIKEVTDRFRMPDDGNEYVLLFAISKDKENKMAFAITTLSVLAGANLKEGESQNGHKLGCSVSVSDDGKNHFWLLKSKQ